MSRSFDFIKDITDAKELWKLGVRLEDMWKTGVGKNEHLEFLILDKQGENIQVLLPHDMCPLWEPKLQEGTTYVMKNFKVQKNDFKVKLCDHPFMLVIVGGHGGTDFIPTRLDNVPNYSLKFKPFSEIKSGNYRDDLLVDVIGAVYELAPPKSNYGSKKFPTSFSIADASMNILTCALWDKYGTQFMEGYNQCGGHGPVVVIIKHGKIKEANGQYDLTISNAWSGTKIIMNQELKEIKDFITSLPEDFVAQTQAAIGAVDGGGGPVHRLLQHNSQGSQYSSGSRYAYLAPTTHISELLILPEEEMVTTVGTTHHVCVSRNGWFYLSCSECNKAVINDTPPYKCKVETHVTPNPGIKYRVEVEVRYQGHKCKFLFWDRECNQLIGKTAAEVRDIMIEEGQFDPREYPTQLDDLCGKELAFKVKIQSKAQMANVISFKDDPEIIQHFKDQIINLEEPVATLYLLPASAGESSKMATANAVGTSEDFSVTPSSKMPTPIVVGTSEDYSVSPLDLSATAESEPDSFKMHTPAKRAGDSENSDDPVSAKLSSNKIKLKSVKKEKIPGPNRDI